MNRRDNPFEPVPGAPRGLHGDVVPRVVSGVAMIAMAIFALWMGGQFFTFFAVVIAGGLLWEWTRVVHYMGKEGHTRIVWLVIGMVYIGWATATLLAFMTLFDKKAVLILLAAVWAVDIGAYFAGRTFGGPRIAPAISPSKTWAGLIGGMIGAMLWLLVGQHYGIGMAVIAWPLGIFIAIVAQAGDFFESWMKRMAGLKDSSNLIPGHGGLFDRLDGLLPVLIFLSIAFMVNGGMPGKAG